MENETYSHFQNTHRSHVAVQSIELQRNQGLGGKGHSAHFVPLGSRTLSRQLEAMAAHQK